jgi:hypothetical protein
MCVVSELDDHEQHLVRQMLKEPFLLLHLLLVVGLLFFIDLLI